MYRFKNMLLNTPRKTCCAYLLESLRRGDSYKYPQDLFLGVKRLFFTSHTVLIGTLYTMEIVYNVKKFGSKHCRRVSCT